MEKKLMVIPPNQMNKSGKERDLKKLRVAAYCRVSTEQEEQLGSLINQVVYYREYIGEKEEYGNTVIIQQIDGIDVWYGNISNTSIKLYDYVEKGNLLGECSNELYLVFKKDGNRLDYENRI